MRLKRFIIAAFALATLILAWPLTCTWKIYQLEKVKSTDKIWGRTTGNIKSWVLESPDSSDEEMKKLAELAGKPLALQFYEVASDNDTQSFYSLINNLTGYKEHLAYAPDTKRLKYTNTSKKEEALKAFQEQCGPHQRVFFGPKEEDDGRPYYQVYLLNEHITYNSKTFVVEKATAHTPGAPQKNRIDIVLDKPSGKLLKELTTEIKDKPDNPWLAIVLDNVVLEVAALNEAIGGLFSITFSSKSSNKEVEKLADQLNSGYCQSSYKKQRPMR